MSIVDKYQSLIDLAQQLGVSELNIYEENGVLYIDGVIGSASAKQRLLYEYNRIDPDYCSGDLVMNIYSPGDDEGVGTSSGGVGASSGGLNAYTDDGRGTGNSGTNVDSALEYGRNEGNSGTDVD